MTQHLWTSRGVTVVHLNRDTRDFRFSSWLTPSESYDGCKVSADGRYLYVGQLFRDIWVIDRINRTAKVIPHVARIFEVVGSRLIYICQDTHEIAVYDPVLQTETIAKFPVTVRRVYSIVADPWTTLTMRIATQVMLPTGALAVCIIVWSGETGAEPQYEKIIPYAFTFDIMTTLAFHPNGSQILMQGLIYTPQHDKQPHPLIQLDLTELSATHIQVAGYEAHDIYHPTWSFDRQYVAFYFRKPDSLLGGIAVARSLTSPGIQLTGSQDMWVTGPMGWTAKNELVFCSPDNLIAGAFRSVEQEES